MHHLSEEDGPPTWTGLFADGKRMARRAEPNVTGCGGPSSPPTVVAHRGQRHLPRWDLTRGLEGEYDCACRYQRSVASRSNDHAN